MKILVLFELTVADNNTNYIYFLQNQQPRHISNDVIFDEKKLHPFHLMGASTSSVKLNALGTVEAPAFCACVSCHTLDEFLVILRGRKLKLFWLFGSYNLNHTISKKIVQLTLRLLK